MKRHIALIPLSHEHHDALILARLIQKGAPVYKGLPTELAPKAEYALDLYEKKLKTHFIREEEIIPIVAGVSAELDILLECYSTQSIYPAPRRNRTPYATRSSR
jgi:lambda repressor-like predicted transcriptional regulator